MLALMAVLAMGALSATAASGAGLGGIGEGENEEIWLHGTDEGEPISHPLTAFEGITKCNSATYTGGKVDATDKNGDHEPFVQASSFTLTPHYEGCTNAGGLPETVTMNGCDYDINIGETIETNKYSVTADLTCPTGKEVTIDVYGNETAHTAGSVLCTIHIASAEGLKGGYLLDETNGHVTLGGKIGPFPVVLTGPSACAGKTVTDPNGFLDVAITLTGSDAATAGNPVPIGVFE